MEAHVAAAAEAAADAAPAAAEAAATAAPADADAEAAACRARGVPSSLKGTLGFFMGMF